ncbi:hypothetical protein [Streptomyces sp. NPDC056069]|uniref:hypothetical protein n=1 Tax=Streptomyces sp. NPDC056069 TaxID=3345702 RepID=UPI0035E1BC87
MPFPPGTPTVTLTGTIDSALAGVGYNGRVCLKPSAYLVDNANHVVYTGGGSVPILDGAWSATILPTNTPGILPAGWVWDISIEPIGGERVRFAAEVTGSGTVHVDDLTPIPSPGGGTGSGPRGPQGFPGPEGPEGPAGPAGGTVRTASVRITDGTITDLPSASSWTIAQTSAGTQLKCSIAAAAGDRIRVNGQFMHDGTRYMDWSLLTAAGALGIYAATGTTSAPGEGNPVFYPQSAYFKYASPEQFTVGAEHVDGTGKVTVALANQGTGPGKVYAHTLYPWRLRLENIGPEPA